MNTENNNIIAEFIGWKEREYYVFETPFFQSLNSCIYHPNELKFHLDWNWLMEVVEKIEIIADWSLELLTTDKKEYQMLIHLSNTNIVTENKIETVYNACIEFIKWYNQQEK